MLHCAPAGARLTRDATADERDLLAATAASDAFRGTADSNGESAGNARMVSYLIHRLTSMTFRAQGVAGWYHVQHAGTRADPGADIR